MKTQLIGGQAGLVSSRLSYGCMRVAGTWNPAEISPERRDKGKKAIIAAYEAGYTLFDHADIYCRGACETIHGEVMREVPGMRRDILIATKCGIRFKGDPNPDDPGRYDFSAEHILRSCDGSLQRLGVEQIDIYQLHRPDVLMNPQEVAGAFDKLHTAGKVRHFGVSNFLPSQVTLLRAQCNVPLVVNQVEIHLNRLDCFTDGTLDQCLELRMTPLSWSPLGGGTLGMETAQSSDPELLTVMGALADRYGCSRACVALAWLLKHPSQIVPIVGSANPDHIRDCVRADAIDLSREDWYRLLIAARGEPMP